MSKVEIQTPIGLGEVTDDDRRKAQNLANLVRTYDDLGGWHIQVNSVATEVLRDAQLHPEQHKDLLIRVAGYSAFFVELCPESQNDIIDRSEYTLA
jgi:choline trimethylamine-lyase